MKTSSPSKAADDTWKREQYWRAIRNTGVTPCSSNDDKDHVFYGEEPAERTSLYREPRR